MIQHCNVMKKILGYIVIIALLLYIFFTHDIKNVIIIITFLAIIQICTYQMFSHKYNVTYGMSQIFYVFCFFFLGVAPLFQYLNNIILWGGSSFNEVDYIKTNFLILLALLVYRIIYVDIFKKKYTIKPNLVLYKGIENENREISSVVLLLISIVASIYLFVLFNCDIRLLLNRSATSDLEFNTSSTISYLVNSFFIRSIPAICFLLFKFYKKKNLSIEIVLLLLMLLTSFPLGIPRFSVAALYIPLVFVYVKSLRKEHNFVLLMIFAVIIVFPLLNFVRNTSNENFISLEMFKSAHFDSYQMFMRVVSTDYVTYGYQLLGVLFFFVPRSIWPSKPIGSGYTIAHENNYFYDNLSMNFFGEGYINFGVIGVVLFALLLGYFNARMDRRYWIENVDENHQFTLIYFVSIGMEFILLRGALLNIFPVFVGYILVIKLVSFMASKPMLKIKNNIYGKG